MIQIFEGAEQPGTNPILDAMHRDRKKVFVDMLGWDVPVIDGQYEVDQFDDENAIYVVASDENGQHEGSIRLLPTTSPHLLGEIFPHLCNGPIPQAPDIFELSRACCPPAIAPYADSISVTR